MNKRFALAILIIIFAAAFGGRAAQARETLVVTVERDSPGGLEQLALIFRDTGAELVTNSNFISTPASAARLGRYQSPLTSNLKTRWDMLEAARNDLGAKTKAENQALDPHRMRYFIGERELEAGSLGRQIASETLERAWERGDWSPTHALELTLKKTGSLAIDEISGARTTHRKAATSDLACRKIGPKSLLCRPQGFGQAYFRM